MVSTYPVSFNPISPTPTTCIIYVRVSTDDQALGDFSSLDAQIAACRRRANENGWKILEIFRDEGASGKDLLRPAMQRMIAKLKRERVGLLLATRLDRLSRSTVDTETLVNLCRERGTEIKLEQQDFNGKTANGRLSYRMGALYSEFEREAIGERVRYKRKELIRNGIRPGGVIPVGFVLLTPHVYAADETYAPMVLDVFERAVAGETIAEIQKHLRKRNYVFRSRASKSTDGSKGASGKPFTWDQINAMIQNPVYRAVIVDGGAEFALNIPQLVPTELWHKANSAVTRTRRRDYKPRQNKYDLLLHGLVVCGCCGTPLVAHPATSRTGKTYLYYRCQNLRRNGGSSGCTIHQVPALKLEGAIVDQIGIFGKDPVVLDAAIDEVLGARKQQLQPLKIQIASVDEGIAGLIRQTKDLKDRLVSLPRKSPFVTEIVAEGDKVVSQRKELELRRQHLLEERATLEQGLGNAAQIRSDMGRFSDIFGVLTPDKKRQALKLLIHRIVVNHMPDGVTKSTGKNGSNGPFRQKNSFSVNLELYVKSKFSNSLRKEAGFFVFHTEMAARAGIEPATK